MFDDEDNDQEGLFTRLLATLFMVLAVVVFGTLSLPRVKNSSVPVKNGCRSSLGFARLTGLGRMTFCQVPPGKVPEVRT